MRIDSHIHLTPPDMIRDWEKIAQKEPYFKLLSESPVNKFATAEQVVAALEADGFDQAFVFGFAFQDMGLCRHVNDYVAEKSREYPKQLIGFAVLPPQDPEAEGELVRSAEQGLRGVGELYPEGQGFRLDSHKEMRNFAHTCMALDFPVMFHLNEPVGHYYAGKTGTSLAEAEAFAANFPPLKTILSHWGGGLFFYELMGEVSARLQNVYYDTAASVFLYGHKVYDAAQALGLTHKILFGSDYPLLPPRRYFEDLDRSRLSGEEKEAILGRNAWRLLTGADGDSPKDGPK